MTPRTKNPSRTSHYTKQYCPHNSTCPFQGDCGAARGGGGVFLPETAIMKKGSRLWTNWENHRYIYVIRSGLFESVVHSSSGDEFPFALYNNKNAIGLSELYIPSETAEAYSLRTLFDGEVCCVPHIHARNALSKLNGTTVREVLCLASCNQSTSAMAVTKILAHKTVHEKLLSLFFTLKNLTESSEMNCTRFKITHEEIASIICADRGSVTRTLKKLADLGIVELGYSSVTIDFIRCEDIEDDEFKHKFYPITS